MADSSERLVNLALYLARSAEPVTWTDIREEVAGYPEDQEEPTFRRMLERDKDDLRAAGFVIVCEDDKYSLDRSATYVAPLEMTPAQAAAVSAAGTAMLGDPSFPFAEDLRLALAKLSAETPSTAGAAGGRLVDEEPEAQAELVARLTEAASTRKRIAFTYTNARKTTSTRTLEPYGLFLYDGRWYLVGRDADKDEVRTFTVNRVEHLELNAAKPKSPDFERPDDFDLSRLVKLPFQFGAAEDEFEAVLKLTGPTAALAQNLTMGQGTLEPADDHVIWRVPALSERRLLRFVIEQGPGIHVVGPPQLRDLLKSLLRETEALHGQA